jgi:FPC/CPF motif-containing protein YcgG
MLPARNDNDHAWADRFRQFIGRPTFPCVGAKSALSRNQLTFVVARDITSAWDDMRIYPALFNFARSYRPGKRLYQSFVVIFQGPRTLTEAEFERHLWERVQSLTDKDEWHGQRHDRSVSPRPEEPHFSLSFGGEAFFCVGMHPKANRPARRFPVPAIVFNLHDQFEELRKTGIYEKLHDKILERDVRLAGSVNPMLQRFGESSEARQYSGRQVGTDWKCPYRRESTNNDS